VKALPWIALIVMAVVAALMFRYQPVNVPTPDGERMGTMDRLTGRIELAPVSWPDSLGGV
jgi:hypothetical protein